MLGFYTQRKNSEEIEKYRYVEALEFQQASPLLVKKSFSHLSFLTIQLHGAESFLRSKQILSYSRNSSHLTRGFTTVFTTIYHL